LGVLAILVGVVEVVFLMRESPDAIGDVAAGAQADRAQAPRLTLPL
jgi:hypothetical protein